MGIRFYCPNGHKLNVKEFQSGKKGICPFCGSRIEIPTESTRESSKHAKASNAPNHDARPPGQSETVPPTMPSSPTPVGSSAPMSAATPVPQPSVSGPAHAEPQTYGTGTLPPTGPLPTSSVSASTASAGQTPPDPLVEAGNVVWYVRPASGGQFGPAGADVMRSWIEEGRVSADSLVWHEGWRDWQEASEVFVQLGAAAEDFGGEPIGTAAGSRASILRNNRAVARRRSNTTQTLVIAGLILAVIILLVIFVAVIFGGSANADDGRRLAPVSTSHSLPNLFRVHSELAHVSQFQRKKTTKDTKPVES
ncbi:MAG: DUF4339 domain-containing protein [Thermoguttaceae bacterium]